MKSIEKITVFQSLVINYLCI